MMRRNKVLYTLKACRGAEMLYLNGVRLCWTVEGARAVDLVTGTMVQLTESADGLGAHGAMATWRTSGILTDGCESWADSVTGRAGAPITR